MCLEALLLVFRQADKFYPHAHPGIAGPDHPCGRNFFIPDPECNMQRCAEREGDHRFNITTTPTDIRCICMHGDSTPPVVSHLYGISNPVAGIAAFIGVW